MIVFCSITWPWWSCIASQWRRANASLSYPHFVILFLQHFNVPLEDEPFVKVKQSFAIGAGAVASFGYRKDLDGQWVCKHNFPPLILDE